MSSVYNLEPQPTGSAIVHTTAGELSVELWCKQTPLTCRNFLQLAVDGYYDGTVFHRLVPGFILQGGDPTGTGSGGESIYDGGAFGEEDTGIWPMEERKGANAGEHGVGFKDEFHSRLKLNRRGLLAMANEGTPDTNGSQFFFTLDKADELTGKNTLFGRVAGDTIYNLAKMGEAEVDAATERPLYPVRITHIEVLINPFDDMKRRARVAVATKQVKKQMPPPDKKKRKGTKALLSFGADEGEDEEPVVKKAKFDSRIVMDDGPASEPVVVTSRPKHKDSAKSKVEKKLGKEAEGPRSRHLEDEPSAPQPPNTKGNGKPKAPTRTDDQPAPESDDDDDDDAPKRPSGLEQTKAEIAALKASMRRTIHSEAVDAAAAAKEKPKSALESMIPDTSTRGAQKRRGRGGTSALADGDPRIISLFKAFQSRLEQAPPEREGGGAVGTAFPEEDGSASAAVAAAAEDGNGDEAELCDLHFIANCQSCRSWVKAEEENAGGDAAKDSDDEEGEGWMNHALNCAADKLGKDLNYRRKAEEEMVVIDPRQKESQMREEKRERRDARAEKEGRTGWAVGRDKGGSGGGGGDWGRERRGERSRGGGERDGRGRGNREGERDRGRERDGRR